MGIRGDNLMKKVLLGLLGAFSLLHASASHSTGDEKVDVVNAIFESAYEITQERFLNLRWSLISNTIRENMCGYWSWSEKIDKNTGLYTYFPNACEAIKHK